MGRPAAAVGMAAEAGMVALPTVAAMEAAGTVAVVRMASQRRNTGPPLVCCACVVMYFPRTSPADPVVLGCCIPCSSCIVPA